MSYVPVLLAFEVGPSLETVDATLSAQFAVVKWVKIGCINDPFCIRLRIDFWYLDFACPDVRAH